MRVYTSRSVSGLSKNSIICYTICLGFRLLSLTRYDGYLPYDSTGDFIYRLAETLSFVFCGIVLYFMVSKFKTSYNWDLDTY